MRILVIGGTGHIGSHLVPRLVRRGWAVTVIARHPRPHYADPRLGWHGVTWISADRTAEEREGTWARRMAALETEVVIDLIAYTPEQNRLLYEAFRGRITHFLHAGTVWAYGPPVSVPADESCPRRPITDYGRQKADIEAFLLGKWRTEGFPATVIHPGHICGRQWLPIDPQGSRDGTGVYEKLARGLPVLLPDRGQATLHHVHADDVAQQFEQAILERTAALGESFSAVAPYAMTLVGCCHAVATMLGAKPNLQFVPLEEMDRHVGDRSAAIIREHVLHSPCASIARAQRLLGYRPRYTTEQIYAECLEALLESGQVKL